MLCKFENGRCVYHFYRTEAECRAINDEQTRCEQIPTYLNLLNRCLAYLSSPDQEGIVGRDALFHDLSKLLHPRPLSLILCACCGARVEQASATLVVGGYLCDNCK